jgi:hypothetical protein
MKKFSPNLVDLNLEGYLFSLSLSLMNHFLFILICLSKKLLINILLIVIRVNAVLPSSFGPVKVINISHSNYGKEIISSVCEIFEIGLNANIFHIKYNIYYLMNNY